MTNRLDVMRAALAAKNEKKTTTTKGDTANFPFWLLKNGEKAVLRLFPDLDEENPFFWREQQIIKMPFNGQVGGQYATNHTVEVTVPCVKQWGMQCPILSAISSLWDAGDESRNIARTYNRQRLFKYQGSVVQPGIKEDNTPENSIRRFTFKIKLHTIIEQSLMDPELTTNPIDFEGGRDFVLRKTMSGQWPDYSSSNWSFQTRSIDENERIALAQYGLWDLSKFVGEKPDQTTIDMIYAMYLDSRAGRPFDTASYGEKFRAYNKRGGDDNANETVTETVQAARVQVPVQTPVAARPVQQAVVQETYQRAEEPDEVVEVVTASVPVGVTASVNSAMPSVAASAETAPPRVTDPKELLAQLRAKSKAATA